MHKGREGVWDEAFNGGWRGALQLIDGLSLAQQALQVLVRGRLQTRRVGAQWSIGS
jgi:hypothetical protein